MSAGEPAGPTCHGLIPFAQQRGRWSKTPGQPTPSPDEFENVYERLSARLARHLGPNSAAAYFRGDHTGECTQQLEFTDFAALTPHLVREVSRWLRDESLLDWRIWVWGPEPRHALLIYPDAVFIDRRLRDEEQDAAIAALADMHVRRTASAARSAEAGLERLRPLLPAAYAEAAARRNVAHAVLAERAGGPDEPLVHLWVLHPRDRETFDLDDYEIRPDATYEREFYVLADGTMLSADEEPPAGAMLLALWEFAETPERAVTFFRGRSRSRLSY